MYLCIGNGKVGKHAGGIVIELINQLPKLISFIIADIVNE